MRLTTSLLMSINSYSREKMQSVHHGFYQSYYHKQSNRDISLGAEQFTRFVFFLSQRFISKPKFLIFFFITVNKNFEANAINITMAVTFNSLVLIVNVFVLFWVRVR